MANVLDRALSVIEDQRGMWEANALSAAKAKRGSKADVPALATAGGEGMFGGSSNVGKATRAYSFYKNWVSVCIACIANRISAQPWCVGNNPRAKSKGKTKPGKPKPESSARLVKWTKLPAFIREKAAPDA